MSEGWGNVRDELAYWRDQATGLAIIIERLDTEIAALCGRAEAAEARAAALVTALGDVGEAAVTAHHFMAGQDFTLAEDAFLRIEDMVHAAVAGSADAPAMGGDDGVDCHCDIDGG